MRRQLDIGLVRKSDTITRRVCQRTHLFVGLSRTAADRRARCANVVASEGRLNPLHVRKRTTGVGDAFFRRVVYALGLVVVARAAPTARALSLHGGCLPRLFLFLSLTLGAFVLNLQVCGQSRGSS
jgi:hypothetical protein